MPLLPKRVILLSFVVLRQMLLRRSAWKLDSSRPAFRGHSMSSEATRIDPLPMTSY